MKDGIKKKRRRKGDARKGKNKYLNDSVRLANFIQENIDTYSRARAGDEEADMPIMEGMLMPALVVEIGFATNPEEKKKLISAKRQTEIAKALAKSIILFYR